MALFMIERNFAAALNASAEDLRAVVDINTIRGWLGHVSINTTNVYYRQKVFMHSSQGKGFVGKASALVFCT